MPDVNDGNDPESGSKSVAVNSDDLSVRPLPEVRQLTRNELEALRSRLEQKFH